MTLDPKLTISSAVQAAFSVVLGDGHKDSDPAVRLSQNQKFGDYQINGIMGLAKKLGQNPRELAEKIVGTIKLMGLHNRLRLLVLVLSMSPSHHPRSLIFVWVWIRCRLA